MHDKRISALLESVEMIRTTFRATKASRIRIEVLNINVFIEVDGNH